MDHVSCMAIQSVRSAVPSRRFVRCRVVCILGASCLSLTASAYPPGIPWTGEAGITESIAALRIRDEAGATQATRPARQKPVLRPDRSGLARDSRSPAAPQTVLSSQTPVVIPLASQVVGTSFTGATLADTGNSFPPDTMGAAGPTQFIVAINGRIRSFNKTTGVADGVLNLDMDMFFTSVMTPPVTTNYTSDPHIRYDRLSGRWFVVMIDVPGGGSLPNRILLAVSSGGTITNSSAFTFFYFQHDTVSPAGDTGDFADYPTLGIDNNALYIGDNVFTARGSFVGTSGFVVRKSSILGAGPIVVTAFRGLVPSSSSDGPYSPQGVDNYDPAATEGYFIGSSNSQFGELVVRRISTPGGTPSISSNILITVPATATPITVPHLGNTGGVKGNLDALDDRLFAAHIRNGVLWTAHNIRVDSSGAASTSGNRNGSRWYAIQNLTGTPSVAQSGTVFDSAASNPKSFWIPTIMVSGQGHAAMGFSTAGANNHINAGTCGRLSGDPAGTMQTAVDYTASSTAYNPTGDKGSTSGRRWGDFSFTSLDPNDDMTMWTIQEFCDAANSYGVRVVKLSAPPPATPASCSPSLLSGNHASVNVTVTGTPVAGSGFFDPGSGFANRLTATVSGGVVVNSVSFSSPTSVILNLNTTGAASGVKTVTVTNPDNQAVSSASGILTIDTTAPVVTPPANVTALPASSAGATVTYAAATATDAMGVVLITYSQNSGTLFPIGTTTVTVTAWDAANNPGTATFTVTVSPLTPVQSWREVHFNTILNTGNAADTADPNGNGIINLVEYALGGDPSGGTTGTTILPKPGRSPANTLQIRFTRYQDRSDLTLTVQASDSPAAWTDLARSTAGAPFVLLAPGATATETGTGNTRQVTVTDLYPVTDPAHPRRFMRLKITTSGAN